MILQNAYRHAPAISSSTLSDSKLQAHNVQTSTRVDTKENENISLHLTVAAQAESVVALPASMAGRTVLGVGEATRAASSGEGRPVLVHGVDDPVDPGVMADGVVMGVDKDDLKVLVGGVLVHPVRVEDAKISAPK
eukprot:1377665-Amorphochlora_amoeboformis.AAC.1